MTARTGAVVVGCVLLAACGSSGAEHGDSPDGALAGVTVAAEAHADTYQRTAFGQRWRDTDRNGCGQRDDVLARDLTGITRRGRCVVVAGALVDPYTGQQVTFVKARASEVQIDHVVALAEAWRSGAWSWTPDRREAYANDLTVLQASAGRVNQAKGDADAAGWSPDGGVRRCRYAGMVVQVKARWGLTADPVEVDALAAMIRDC
jgi:hypothetical protein